LSIFYNFLTKKVSKLAKRTVFCYFGHGKLYFFMLHGKLFFRAL
jgi:hypothetical protein